MSAYEAFKDYARGKKITVVGLGLLGGLGDIRFLAQHAGEIVVTDQKSEAELQSALGQLKSLPNIRYTLGRHDLADFRGRDLIIKAPAMPLDSPYIAEAKKEGTPVTMWAALFARFAREGGTTIVGITGTRGKTTTTFMLADILKAAGKAVFLGGNVQGIATLAQLPEVKEDSIAVFELDSWKIQGFRDEGFSPHVGIFTTFYPDHLNYYQGDMEAYLADKAQIFLDQNAGDTLVLGEQAAPIIEDKYKGRIPSKVVVAHAADLPEAWELKVPGEHNRANAACALQAARALGVADEVSRAALERFAGASGRLELVRILDGVQIYNDTTSTTPEATIAALRALDPSGEQRVILIAGGADKGLDLTALIPEIERHAREVVLLSGTGTSALSKAFPDAPIFEKFEPAVKAAVREAQPGEAVLLSPALASFGMFQNEYDRGAQFDRIIRELK